MRISRTKKNKQESDYELVIQKQRMRKIRENMSGKDHLLGNLNSKKGMRLLRSEGNLNKFVRREKSKKVGKNWDELFDWKGYYDKSHQHSQNLQSKQPDIVERINEINRSKKERERQSKEQYKAGCWDYDGENGEWYWTGDDAPEIVDNFAYSPPTKEELKLFREAEDKLYEEQDKYKKGS